MQRRSQGDGRGRRGTIRNREEPLDDRAKRGMELLGPLYTTSRENRLYELGGLSEELACPLSVSTRGIGFVIFKVVSKLRQQFPEQSDEIPDLSILYRASLAQLQEKMDLARALPLAFPLQTDCPLFDAWPSPFAIDRPPWILQSNHVNLSQVALIINSIGNFDYRDKNFGSVFMKEVTPLNLQITNLRDYCLEMANPETEPWKRRAGFELNSIPTAIWKRKDDDDPMTVVLTNPDDVIPPEYDHNALSRDLIKMHQWIDKISAIVPELRGEIDYKRDGDPSLLVSTHVVPGQSMRLEKDGLSGDQSVFWAREGVDHDAWAMGIFSMVGEVLNPLDGGHRSNVGGSRCCLFLCKLILHFLTIGHPPWNLQSNHVHLSQVALIINSIGNFEYKDKNFGSVFMKEVTPLNLQITNLRDYCLEMADPETEPWKRRAGFELNSIPTAIWKRKDDDDPMTVVLTNPDDVIPPEYDHNALSRDLIKMHQWIDKISTIVPELRGEIDYKRDGDPSLLVSTHVVPGQSMRLEKDGLSGDQSIFWAREGVDHDAWAMGIFSMVGEVLNPLDGGHRSNVGGSRCCVTFPLQTDTPLFDLVILIGHPPWILQSNHVHLSQVVLIINSIGNFDYKDKNFGSVFMKEVTPLNLQITNLRDYCLEMANPETEPWKRRAGFELNSIPTAIWKRKDDDDPITVVLTNPDDVIPPEYDHNALSRDLIKMHQWIDKISAIVPELRGGIDYKRDEDPSLLVSTHVVPGQSMRLEKDGLSGDQSVFWAREGVDHDAWAMGIFSMVGEVLNPLDGGHRSNVGGSRCCLSWSSICDMLL